MGKQQFNEQSRVRATTHQMSNLKGDQVAGLVLKLSPEGVKDLIDALNSSSIAANGATLFLNTFENESQFNPGDTYLSSTISIEPTEPRDSGKTNSRFASRKQQTLGKRAQMAKNVDKVLGSKRG